MHVTLYSKKRAHTAQVVVMPQGQMPRLFESGRIIGFLYFSISPFSESAFQCDTLVGQPTFNGAHLRRFRSLRPILYPRSAFQAVNQFSPRQFSGPDGKTSLNKLSVLIDIAWITVV